MTDSISMPRQPDFGASRGLIRAELEQAIRARGLRRFAILHTVGEGRFYPNGMEERSGDVMDEEGRIWMFWTAWDPVREEVTLQDWEEAHPSSSLKRTRGYAQARRELGLDEAEPTP